MTTYVFPGQGAQTVGMGKDLFSQFPELTQQADDILGYSIEKLCLEPNPNLNQTNYTQPAIYIVNALTYFNKLKQLDEKPNYVAGHSLGEYNALMAAEVFDFATGLKLVMRRGLLMSQAEGGGMAAVIGLKPEAILTEVKNHNLQHIYIANYNSFTQTVITGLKSEIDQAKSILEKAGAMFIPLKVSGAFHSPYMQPAANEFNAYLKEFQFGGPKIKVIANINALPYEENAIVLNLTEQITHSVEWTKTIEFLLKQGETNFQEVGPGSVLTGLIKRIQRGQ